MNRASLMEHNSYWTKAILLFSASDRVTWFASDERFLERLLSTCLCARNAQLGPTGTDGRATAARIFLASELCTGHSRRQPDGRSSRTRADQEKRVFGRLMGATHLTRSPSNTSGLSKYSRPRCSGSAYRAASRAFPQQRLSERGAEGPRCYGTEGARAIAGRIPPRVNLSRRENPTSGLVTAHEAALNRGGHERSLSYQSVR